MQEQIEQATEIPEPQVSEEDQTEVDLGAIWEKHQREGIEAEAGD